MRILIRISSTVGLALILFLAPVYCYANPIPGPPPPSPFWIIMIFSPFIEGYIVRRFVKKSLLDKDENFFWMVVLYNIVTLIVTQILVYLLFNAFDNKNYYYLAEIFPLVTETFLLWWLIRIFYKRKYLSRLYSWRRIILITIIANMITFGLGILVNIIDLSETIF